MEQQLFQVILKKPLWWVTYNVNACMDSSMKTEVKEITKQKKSRFCFNYYIATTAELVLLFPCLYAYMFYISLYTKPKYSIS